MRQSLTRPARSRSQRGVASVLLLFALSAFSVLGVATLTTNVADSPSGETFHVLMSGDLQDNQTRLVTPITVPESWRLNAREGNYTFQLPVIVPENGNDETGATAAWHTMTESEVPGMTVCCATRGRRLPAAFGRRERDCRLDTRSANESRWLSLRLATKRCRHGTLDLVTATILSTGIVDQESSPPSSASSSSRGPSWRRARRSLSQVPRTQPSDLRTDLIEGTLNLWR